MSDDEEQRHIREYITTRNTLPRMEASTDRCVSCKSYRPSTDDERWLAMDQGMENFDMKRAGQIPPIGTCTLAPKWLAVDADHYCQQFAPRPA